MFNREKSAKLYNSLAYWVSIWMVYFISLVIPNFIYAVVTYFSSDLIKSASGFFLYFTVLYISSMCAYFICNLLTMLSPNAQTAMGIYPILTFVNVLFSGYFQYIDNMQTWLKYWLPNLSFMRWGYQCLVCNLLTDNPDLPDGSKYLAQNSFDTVNDYESFIILLGFTFTFVAILVIRIRYKYM